MADPMPPLPPGPPGAPGPPGGPPPPGMSPAANRGPAAPVDPTLITQGDLGNDLFTAPFSNSGMPVEEYGVRWWFEYFWSEARNQGNAPSLTPGPLRSAKLDMVEVVNAVFSKERIPGGIRLRMRPWIEHWNTPTPGRRGDPGRGGVDTNAVWKDCLVKLLRIGFRAVRKEEITPSTIPLLELDENRAPQHMLQQRMFGIKVAELEKNMNPAEVPVYWRSETRDVDRILSQQGTRRQCDVETIARDMNMTASWHPFSDPEINKYMWFRLKNKDNDYFTVISVATNFETACGFPKINERRVYQFPDAPVERWSKSQADQFRSNLGLVTEDGQPKVRLITTTTTYLLVHTGSVLDTMGANRTKGDETFPEVGVERIALDNIYGVIPIQRVHHGPGESDGFTVFVDFAKGRRLHADKELDLFGLHLASRLFNIYMEKRFASAFATAWTKAGAGTPAVPRNISRIREFPISQVEFEKFRATLSDAAAFNAFDRTRTHGEKMKDVMAILPRKP